MCAWSLRLCALAVIALVLVACGSSGSHELAANVRVLGGMCTSSSPSGRGPANCIETFSDGERFSCSAFPPRVSGAHAGAEAVARDRKCQRTQTVPVPAELGPMTRQTDAVVACLNRHHLRASGFSSFVDALSGPLAGEIDSDPTYITIYLTPGVAARSMPKPANGSVRVGRFILLATHRGAETPVAVRRCLGAARAARAAR
jgi:hypothetical protein